MKLNKNQLAKYNTPDTVAVVSLYPKRGEIYSAGASGVASYTKNVVREMGQKVVVIGDRLNGKAIYEEANSLVTRVWQANHPKMWLEVLSVLRQLTQVKSLLIHFDFSMYGGMVTSGLMLPFLGLTRLLGFAPTVVSHHVIRDVRKLSGQVGLGEGIKSAVKAKLYNLAFKSFYWLLGKVASKVVVLEEPLQARLTGIIPADKLVVIPHAVDKDLVSPSKAVARKRLGYAQDEQVVMFFGYVNWFKGADFFARAVKDITQLNGKKVRFVMAGGKSPTMKDKGFYQNFYARVTKAVETSKSLELTGYVPQEKIADYFAACDLVVFPYREFMCASGVMSLVFSYQKPFIVSNKLLPMLSAPDFTRGLRQVGLRAMDMTFVMTKRSLVEVMERVLENGLKAKMRSLTRIMRDKRDFTTTANLYTTALQTADKPSLLSRAKGALAYVKASL